jgi:hypothetical protein
MPNKNSWHSSYAPACIIKAVTNKQTRPTSRAFAFNAPQQAVPNQYFVRKPNGMKILQTQPAEAQFSIHNPNVYNILPVKYLQ